MNTEVKKNRKV